MKETAVAVGAAATLVIGPLAGGAMAHVHEDHGDIPPHPHVRLLHAEFSEEGLTYRKCIDLAGNNTLPLHAHHAHLHFGRAGEAQQRAGHLVVPLAPFLPFPIHNCAELAVLFPPTP